MPLPKARFKKLRVSKSKEKVKAIGRTVREDRIHPVPKSIRGDVGFCGLDAARERHREANEDGARL